MVRLNCISSPRSGCLELGNEMKAIIQKKSIKENEQLKAFGLIRNDGKNGMIPMGKLVTEFFMKHL